MNLATWGPLLMGLHHPYAPLLASSAFLFTFVLLPCIDVVLGAEPFPEPFASHPEASPSLIQSDALFRINVRALVPVHAATVLGLAHAVTVAVAQGAPAAVWAGWVASLVPFGGLAFTAAHEMVHGDQTNRMLARITLGILCYGHWERGHLQHHAKVGTWEDPSTARMGETFYAFAIRNVRGNLAEAWNFEARRLRTAGLPPWHPTNMFFRWAAASAAPAAAAWALFGGAGLLAFAMQACAGIFALQLADYIEHYGLERSMDPATGAPRTRVSVRDSWNADWIATNCVLFALQRHSHHHAQASRPYQKLATMDGSPQLPMSYPPLSLTALVPPLFQSIMGPRAAWQRHVSQSNSDHRAAEAEL